jgi:glycosyltransferase involved in cell wall biosynthesis
MKEPLISIIVPIYNVEKYLSQCLSSILSQTYSKFEILLVDDGSTDGSGNICDNYLGVDDRIRVFHKKNGGVSSARNYGIDNADGKYVCFIDADDWVNSKFLETFVKYIDEGADLYIQGYIDRDNILRIPSYSTLRGIEEICNGIYKLEEQMILGLIWNKLYRLDLIREYFIRFDEQVSIGEDMIFILSYIWYSRILVTIPVAYYNYENRYGSACSNDFSFEIWNRRLFLFEELLQNYRKVNIDISDKFRKNDFFLAIHVLRIAYHDNIKKEKRVQFLNDIKKRGKGNKQIRLFPLKNIDDILPFMILKINPEMADSILYHIGKLIYFIKKI